MLDDAAIDRWLQAYLKAWGTDAPDDIVALFGQWGSRPAVGVALTGFAAGTHSRGRSTARSTRHGDQLVSSIRPKLSRMRSNPKSNAASWSKGFTA